MNLLTYQDSVCVPEVDDLRLLIVQDRHDSPAAGHPSRRKTLSLVCQSFFWLGMSKFVHSFVDSCETCWRIKAVRHKPYGHLKSLPVPPHPWSSISMDLIEQLPPSSDFTAILVVVDRLTKMAIFVPTTNELDAPKLAKLFLHHVYSKHGLPTSIVSDRGSEFTSHFWRSLSTLLGIENHFSSAYHPQSDGQTKRINQVLEQFLRGYSNHLQTDWSDLLPLAEFSYNNAEHASTQLTPFFANYGYHPRFSFDNTDPASPALFLTARSYADQLKQLHEYVRGELVKANSQAAEQFDKRRLPAPQFRPGDRVWLSADNIRSLRPTKKLDYHRLGPFSVSEIISSHAYRLQLPPSMKIHNVFHVDRLEPYVANTIPNRVQPPPPPVEIESDLEYEVKQILDSKVDHRYRDPLFYLVRWVGYGPDHNSWEPASNLTHASNLITEFHTANPTHPSPTHCETPPLSSFFLGGDTVMTRGNGGEWCSVGAEDWQTQEGFKWKKSVLGISIQNGRAERAIRLVQEKMRLMLIGRACPRELWLYAITAAAHMMNLTPSATKTIPHEAFYGTTTHKLAQQLRVFGCLAWVHVQWKDQQGKYGARAKPAIMIGYDNKHKAWKFCNPDQPTSIQWSNSAMFHEDKEWSNHQQEACKPITTSEVEEEDVAPTTVEEETRSEATVEDLLPAIDSTVGTTNTAVLNLDPTLGEAMNCEDSQLWKEAIQKELEGLEAMGTWKVVHHLPGVPLVDSKVRWLGTISIDTKVMMTPRSGVSVDGDEVDGVGDEVWLIPGPQWTTAFGSIYIRTANLLWAPSDVRVPSSSSTVQGGPSSTTPVLLSCVDSFDTAPPPCYPACLAPLCLLSCVDSFDTAPPPQDLLAGLLCTAPPPSTVLGPPCIRAGPPCPWSPWRLQSPWRLPSNHACYWYQLGLWPLARPSLDLLWWSSSMTRALAYDIVLRLKLDADGVPIKHKARLVARGFTQREGIDYQETFSPVAPLRAIRAILALAMQNNWEVHALDITMAYLNSMLKEAIYIKPPEGSGVAPGQVYKVECAPCIYTKGQGEDMAIVVIYVDDTLVIAPRLETVLKVKKQIGQRWKMEDSGEVSHCHGPECTGSMKAVGSYGIGELVDISRKHGRSAVSMETMDSYEFTCKGGPGPYARRASHEEDQAQGAGTATKGLERQEPKEPSPVKGKEQCMGNQQVGPEEEEQC
ncbi:uncharacterized protein UDID_17215 [Ustilago sp. UG-2017a]|nr:uncharacterized protein UDID_17215 [Ustilago sp. UG-2017a]